MRFGGATAGLAAVAVAAGLSACGGGAADTAGEATGHFPVEVHASFPQSQHLAQATELTITVTNTGSRALPDPAVTITSPHSGTAAQAFGGLISASAPGQPVLAGRSRPDWIVDRPPGPCQYSCSVGGPGADATAFADTWATGQKLAPGQTARFVWKLTAVKAGSFAIRYQVAAGLSGKSIAQGNTSGTFNVNVSGRPREQYVNNAGQVVG